MTSSSESKPASTELTSGAGFSYEDTVLPITYHRFSATNELQANRVSLQA
jgi:hypothetical protein